jgi:hypothetical protein
VVKLTSREARGGLPEAFDVITDKEALIFKPALDFGRHNCQM